MAKAVKKAKNTIERELHLRNFRKFVNQVSPRSSKPVKGSDNIYFVEDPLATYTSRIRPIGNSKGVILNSQLIESAGLNQDLDILVQARDGIITIMQMKDTDVNSDLSTWDQQFKAAIRKGAKPDKDMFGGMENDFDKNEW